MNQTAIFAPVFAMLFLTMIVWIYLVIRRILFFQNAKLDPDQIKPGELAQISPPAVSNPSDNFKNLFEVPIIFYTLTIYLFITNQVDTIYLVSAWVFVAFRMLHSGVHCTINIVALRFVLYLGSIGAICFILLRAALQYFGS